MPRMMYPDELSPVSTTICLPVFHLLYAADINLNGGRRKGSGGGEIALAVNTPGTTNTVEREKILRRGNR